MLGSETGFAALTLCVGASAKETPGQATNLTWRRQVNPGQPRRGRLGDPPGSQGRLASQRQQRWESESDA